MRVLLDENLPRALKRHFAPDVQAVTVAERGWAGTRNGALLQMAQSEFDAFITADKGVPHQQNLTRYALAIVILKAGSNRISELSLLMPEVNRILPSAKPGSLIRIP